MFKMPKTYFDDLAIELLELIVLQNSFTLTDLRNLTTAYTDKSNFSSLRLLVKRIDRLETIMEQVGYIFPNVWPRIDLGCFDTQLYDDEAFTGQQAEIKELLYGISRFFEEISVEICISDNGTFC